MRMTPTSGCAFRQHSRRNPVIDPSTDPSTSPTDNPVTDNSAVPVQVSGLTDVTAIAGGDGAGGPHTGYALTQ